MGMVESLIMWMDAGDWNAALVAAAKRVALVESLVKWTISTGVGSAVQSTAWMFPAGETLHFVGLSLLIGTVGVVDLRLLGVFKALPFAPLYRLLLRWGVAGFIINFLTGIMFWFVQPDFYALDQTLPFTLKMLFILLAGINVLVFYLAVYDDAMSLGPGEEAPPLAKVIAGASLFLWFGVLFFGRMVMYT